MEWFGIAELGVVAFGAWILLSVTLLPRVVKSTRTLAIIVLLSGSALFWGFYLFAPRSPFIIMSFNIIIVVAGLLAVFHRELIIRRRTGRWEFLDGPLK